MTTPKFAFYSRSIVVLLLVSCGSAPVVTSGVVGERRPLDAAEVPEVQRFELLWPRMETYAESLAYVPEGLSDTHGDSNICKYNQVTERVKNADGSERCVLQEASATLVGGQPIFFGLLASAFEHDGMYGQYYGVIAGIDAGPTEDGSCCRITPVALFTQWDHAVYDAGTEVTVQGYIVADFDGDQITEMCIEERREAGVGLFELMDLEDQGKKWHPTQQELKRHAYVLDQKRFILAPHLTPLCPDTGYQPFIALPPYPDGVGWRAAP